MELVQTLQTMDLSLETLLSLVVEPQVRGNFCIALHSLADKPEHSRRQKPALQYCIYYTYIILKPAGGHTRTVAVQPSTPCRTSE